MEALTGQTQVFSKARDTVRSLGVLAKNYSPLVSKQFGTLGLANLVKIDGKVRTDSHPLANATMGSDKGKKAALKFANDCSYPVNERDKEVSDDEAKEKKMEVRVSVLHSVVIFEFYSHDFETSYVNRRFKVWKFGNSPITQILRENNFGDSRSAKSAIYTLLGAQNFNFSVNFGFRKCKNF